MSTSWPGNAREWTTPAGASAAFVWQSSSAEYDLKAFDRVKQGVLAEARRTFAPVHRAELPPTAPEFGPEPVVWLDAARGRVHANLIDKSNGTRLVVWSMMLTDGVFVALMSGPSDPVASDAPTLFEAIRFAPRRAEVEIERPGFSAIPVAVGSLVFGFVVFFAKRERSRRQRQVARESI